MLPVNRKNGFDLRIEDKFSHLSPTYPQAANTYSCVVPNSSTGCPHCCTQVGLSVLHSRFIVRTAVGAEAEPDLSDPFGMTSGSDVSASSGGHFV